MVSNYDEPALHTGCMALEDQGKPGMSLGKGLALHSWQAEKRFYHIPS